MGELKLSLPHWSSTDYHPTRRPIPVIVFWSGYRGHSSPRWPVPSRLARTLWPKAHVSSLPFLCPEGASPTHVDQNPLLPSFRRRSHATRDLVHARAGQSRRKGVHPHQDPRSLAFSPRETPNGSFRQLREHLAKDQTRIGGVAQLVSDPRAETRLHSSLPGTGGHPTGHCQYCQKSRSQGYRQVDAQQLLG